VSLRPTALSRHLQGSSFFSLHSRLAPTLGVALSSVSSFSPALPSSYFLRCGTSLCLTLFLIPDRLDPLFWGYYFIFVRGGCIWNIIVKSISGNRRQNYTLSVSPCVPLLCVSLQALLSYSSGALDRTVSLHSTTLCTSLFFWSLLALPVFPSLSHISYPYLVMSI